MTLQDKLNNILDKTRQSETYKQEMRKLETITFNMESCDIKEPSKKSYVSIQSNDWNKEEIKFDVRYNYFDWWKSQFKNVLIAKLMNQFNKSKKQSKTIANNFIKDDMDGRMMFWITEFTPHSAVEFYFERNKK
jgi:hypothetical protein